MGDPYAVPLAHPGGGQPAGSCARSLVELRVGERAVVRHDGEVIGSCPRSCAEPILHALSDGRCGSRGRGARVVAGRVRRADRRLVDAGLERAAAQLAREADAVGAGGHVDAHQRAGRDVAGAARALAQLARGAAGSVPFDRRPVTAREMAISTVEISDSVNLNALRTPTLKLLRFMDARVIFGFVLSGGGGGG